MSNVGFIAALHSQMISTSVQGAVGLGSEALTNIIARRRESDPAKKAILKSEFDVIMARLKMQQQLDEMNHEMIMALCGAEKP